MGLQLQPRRTRMRGSAEAAATEPALPDTGDAPDIAGTALQESTGPLRRDPRTIGLLIVAAWAVPVLTNLVRADALLIVLIIWGTGGLLRAGGTVLDRLMITIALLIGTAITAGLLFSLWPFGLNPIAVGGTALTVLILIGTALRRRPRWPRRVLGTDLALLGAFAVGGFVAYGPSRLPGRDLKLGFATLTGDRLRHFNLFDSIHTIGGYPFLMQSQAKTVANPSMLAVYPPGMHFVYALLDIFVTSRTSTGNAVDEMLRYNVYSCLGYGFMVLSVAWGARWVAGPAMAGWRRAFLVAGISAFLCAGVMTTLYWCGWDPQIFGMGLMALLAAVCIRPPTRPREQLLVIASLCVAISMSYDLYAPFAAVFVVISLALYRKRWLPHWRMALAITVLGLPAAGSYLIGEYLQNTLQSGSALLLTSFTVPMTKLSLAAIAVLAAAGFAVSRARRRPTAVAALAGTVLCGFAVAAFWLYQRHSIASGNSYYFEKTVELWAVIALVGVGTFGHLLRVPARFGARLRIPSHGLGGAAVGGVAIVAAAALTGSIYYGKPQFSYSEMKPGAHTTWERVWMSGVHIYPADADALGYLDQHGMLGDGVPTLVVWSDNGLDNLDLSLTLADLNHAAGAYPGQVNALATSTDFASGGSFKNPWTPAEKAALTSLEQSIAASPVPLRFVTSNASLALDLEEWTGGHGKLASVVTDTRLPGPNGP